MVHTLSWPLWEQRRQFDLGHILSSAVTDALTPGAVGELAPHHAGCWECDLADDSLVWSGGVFDIFGLPRTLKITRADAVRYYCRDSLATIERLRSHAVSHRRGFTVDVEIRAATGDKRWMRVIGAPVCVNDRVARLHGLKLVV